MTGERPQPFNRHEAYNKAAATLERAATNPEYERLAEPVTPLTRDQLTADMLDSPTLPQIVEVFGWPDQTDQANMTPRHSYADDDAFMTALLRKPGELDENGQDISLGNFIDRLATTPTAMLVPEVDGTNAPTGRWKPAKSTFNPYTVDPVVFRAGEIAPDLLDGLHDVLNYNPDGDEGDFINRTLWLRSI
ncbi:MAG TPA: hypothetical protein VH144_00455, partial [Candidatus Saccharimonadales bacterium]|nr:hypothetical protein [Candidatus Saccharimonadales bacterium]